MGTTGVGPFSGDGPLDWVATLADSDRPVEFLDETLREVAEIQQGEYLEEWVAQNALAAAEIVAAAGGNPPEYLPTRARQWLDANTPLQHHEQRQLTDLARRATTRVVEGSQLRVLWEDTELFDDWLQRTEQILERLD